MIKSKEFLPAPDKILDGISLIGFDWSGVISDDRSPVYEVDMQMLEIFGFPRITFEEWLPLTKASAQEFMAAQGINLPSNEILEIYTKKFAAVKNQGLKPAIYPDAKEVLSELNKEGFRLVTISSHPQTELVAEAKEYDVERYFEAMYGSAKDKAQTIICSAAAHSVPLKEMIYVGDATSDIKKAKEAGVKSVAITTGYHTKERLMIEKPDYIIDNLYQLIAL